MAGDGVCDGRVGEGATETGAPDAEEVAERSFDDEAVSDLFVEFPRVLCPEFLAPPLLRLRIAEADVT